MTEQMENKKVSAIVIERPSKLTEMVKSVSDLDEGPNSSQLKIESNYLTEHGLIDLPFSADALLILYEASSVFWACVNQIGKDVAGHGWTLQKEEEAEEDRGESAKAKEFFSNACEGKSLRGMVIELIVDWGTIGNFYMEVVRNNTGNVAKLYRVPAQTMKVNNEKTVYCQTRDDKHVWFKKFGDKEDRSSKDGKVKSEANNNSVDPSAHEMIHYKAPYPRSDFYGAPNIISAIGDVVGLIGCRDYNLSFFDNCGIPSSIVTLSGEWDPKAEQQIRNFFKTELKSASNAHKVLILSQTDEFKLDFNPLDVAAKDRDLSFERYEKTRKENILIAYSMPPERIGMRVIGQLGGNVAEESTKIYINGVVEPLQEDLEAIFNMILTVGLGVTKYKMKFKVLDIRNMTVIADRQSKQIEHGVLKPNEARNELGLKPYDGGDKTYIMANLIETASGTQEPGSIDQLVKAFHESNSHKT